jgi:hypothetical protein
MMIKKYLALRVWHYDKIVAFLREQGVSIIHSRLETRDQALRNLTEGLFDQGVERVIDRHELRWMQVEGDFADDTTDRWSLCDAAMDVDWFEKYKHDIRHCSGVAYWDATHGLAKKLSIKPQDRALSYQVENAQIAVVSESGAAVDQAIIEDSEPLPRVAQIKKTKGRRRKKEVEEIQMDLFG